jgi:hypothetical protein
MESKFYKLKKQLWLKYFKLPLDTVLYSDDQVLIQIRKYFFGFQWYELYDFLEFIISYENYDLLKGTSKN